MDALLRSRRLGQEVVEFLQSPLLSPWQAHQLKHAFFSGSEGV
jgi:hypothetical protein